MPIIIRKVRGKECYRVVNKNTGYIHSYCTTFEKARSQKRLLDAVEHGFSPRRKGNRRSPIKSPNKKKM